MNQWVYKATKAKIDYLDTQFLACERHFLCRSAIESNGSHADLVDQVELGDILHFYYSHGGSKVTSFGSFRVIDGASYTTKFGDRIEGTALFRVREDAENAALIELLTKEHTKDPSKGYQRDPEHECFTGWVIKRLPGTEMKPPTFTQKLFPGAQTSLWPYPSPR